MNVQPDKSMKPKTVPYNMRLASTVPGGIVAQMRLLSIKSCRKVDNGHSTLDQTRNLGSHPTLYYTIPTTGLSIVHMYSLGSLYGVE